MRNSDFLSWIPRLSTFLSLLKRLNILYLDFILFFTSLSGFDSSAQPEWTRLEEEEDGGWREDGGGWRISDRGIWAERSGAKLLDRCHVCVVVCVCVCVCVCSRNERGCLFSFFSLFLVPCCVFFCSSHSWRERPDLCSAGFVAWMSEILTDDVFKTDVCSCNLYLAVVSVVNVCFF